MHTLKGFRCLCYVCKTYLINSWLNYLYVYVLASRAYNGFFKISLFIIFHVLNFYVFT